MTKNIKIQIGEKHIVIKNFVLEKIFLAFSFLVLISTTTYWTLLSTKVESFNSDQLSAPYAFSSFNHIMTSSLTGAHTYLLKWPLFWFIKSFSYAHWTYYLTTLFCVLVTVISLAYIVIKLEKRPMYSGSILLALSSVLLLIPAQSYPGSLLPLNMAMLPTRNIEYVLFIASIYLVLKTKKVFSLSSISSLLILILLFTSDRLFLAIGLGGSILAIVILISKKHWKVLSDLDRWFWYSFFATITSFGLLALISSNNFIHKLTSTGNSYYSLATNFKSFFLGVVYTITGTLSNFGANTAYFNIEIKKIPHDFISSIISVSLIPSIVNLIIFVVVLVSIYKLTIKKIYFDSRSIDNRVLLILLFSSLATILVFIFTNHYYQVDARYLSLILFTGFITLAHYSRLITIRLKILGYIATSLVVSVLIGVFAFSNTYTKQINAFSEVDTRDKTIASALDSQKIKFLVGNYWRIYHVQYLLQSNIQPYPLDLCNETPLSNPLKTDIKTKPFTYMLSLDNNLTGAKGCQPNKIVDAIGNPNRTLVISGSIAKPNELLLTYQHGINLKKTNLTPDSTSTIIPQDISSISFECSGPNVLNIVAHEDDDLLFINPNILSDFSSNRCVKTIYVTAGDAGAGAAYWTGRQNAAENAYSFMIGYKGSWINRTVKLGDNEYVTIATPRLNNKATLIFLNLPDGGIKGNGFKYSNFQTISKLYRGNISSINSVDKQSNYTLKQLEKALETLMTSINPMTIRTQSSFNSSKLIDHSDHLTVSGLVSAAYSNYEKNNFQSEVKIPIYYYAGYPISGMSQNLFGDQLDQKINVFLQYGVYDKAVCGTVIECKYDLTYGSFLPKTYQFSY